MENEPTHNSDEELFTFLLDEIKSGSSDSEIIKKFEDVGVPKEKTRDFIVSFREKAEQVATDEKPTPKAIRSAVFGGILASIIGGAVWGLIVNLTDYEFGYMAVGLGFLTGYGVLLFSKGKRGLPFQIIAVVTAGLGILIGKYIIYVFALTILGSLVGWFDLVWLILTVYVAWRIPRGLLSKY